MAASDAFSPEQIERLRRRYEEGAETIAAIVADENVSEKKLYALRHECGWRARSATRPKNKPRKRPQRKIGPARKPAAPDRPERPARRASPPPPGVVDIATLIERIRKMLEGALESAQTRGPEADPDETARLMASLTRTLQSLRALEKDTTQDERRDDGADAPPLDLAELRRELARRIDRLRQDREGA